MVAPEILGECDLHEQPDTWRDSSKPLRVRWKALRKPTGIQPEQFLFMNIVIMAYSLPFSLHYN